MNRRDLSLRVANVIPSTVGFVVSCCELYSVSRRLFLFRCVLLRVPSCICCSNRLRAVSFCTLREFLAMLPTARMTPDEKRSARDTHKRGLIPKHIEDHLGRSRIDASRMGM